MNMHPLYGMWHALRLAVVFDTDISHMDATATCYPAPPPLTHPCLATACIATQCARVATAMSSPYDPQLWLQVRRACHVGVEHAYGDEQVAYHYTKDRTALMQSIGEKSHAKEQQQEQQQSTSSSTTDAHTATPITP